MWRGRPRPRLLTVHVFLTRSAYFQKVFEM